MGRLPVKVVICLIVTKASAFTASSIFHKRIDQTFISMSAGDSTPEGEFEGGQASSSQESSKERKHPFNPLNLGKESSSVPHSFESEMSLHQSQSVSSERQKRLEIEEKNNSRFLHGDELFELREYVKKAEVELDIAREAEFGPRIIEIQKALEEAKAMDAEYVYTLKLEESMEAQRLGLIEEAKEIYKEAMEARSVLPQFNLEGLWVGKYGDHGYEMINVTYVGDSLIATKVTGDKNVPKGKITFKADLSPTTIGEEFLAPIEISEAASKHWGQKHLCRFPGYGQVASKGFIDSQYVEGQLILVGEYFSFAWIPLEHHIFFGRPSTELTLRLLKQSKLADFGAVDINKPNELAEMRAAAERCLEETEMLIADYDVEGALNFASEDDDYFSQEGCFQ